MGNLLEVIERSKTRPLWRLIYGLGIFHVGVSASRALADHFHSMDALMESTLEELQRIPGCRRSRWGSILQFFRKAGNLEMVAHLRTSRSSPEQPKNDEKAEAPGFKRTTWVLTGTLSQTREEIAETPSRAEGR